MFEARNEEKLTPAELNLRLTQIDPSVVLVPPQILRRVIKIHQKLNGPGLRVPHRKSYIIDRDTLLNIANRSELRIPPDIPIPQTTLLFEQPDTFTLSRVPADLILREYWRLLFHTSVHLTIQKQRLDGLLNDKILRTRIEAIGPIEFAEIQYVLQQENYLFNRHNIKEVYEEFVSVYLELRYFNPPRLNAFFPGLLDLGKIDQLIELDVHSEKLLEQCRPRGAADPLLPEILPTVEVGETYGVATANKVDLHLESKIADLVHRGNNVRAALILTQAAYASGTEPNSDLLSVAHQQVAHLVKRLMTALKCPENQTDSWKAGLCALLPTASRGIWNLESRLLYDLQKICVDVEKPHYSVDIVEPVVTWFRRPIQRPMPDLSLVLIVRHLRKALHRVVLVRISDSVRQQLLALLSEALQQAEHRFRPELKPRMETALQTVGLVPTSTTEELSRDRLIEEWLDRAVGVGRLSISDLRDGIARNRLKMPDLSTPVEFVTGDPLIRMNRELAVRMEGIYRRGEIYLRWLQRLSSIFFGTRVGRALTLYLILPLLGAFFLLKGSDVLSEELHKYVGFTRVFIFPPWQKEVHDGEVILPPPVTYVHWGLLATVTMILLLLFHVVSFRRVISKGIQFLWKILKGILYDLPRSLVELDVVRQLLTSRIFQHVYRFGIKPVFWTAFVASVLYILGTPMLAVMIGGVTTFLFTSLLINTRLGLVVEEAAVDGVSRTWHLLRDDLLYGLIRWIIWFFHWLSEQFEKLIYTVDEWMIFRSGDSRFSFWLKLVLGTIWFCITYLFRFIFYVLVEPQINPIKHFPVVTVSHKLSLLSIQPLAGIVASAFQWSLSAAISVVTLFLSLIPGVFGFLAWELKENWRLYRANQSPTLDPEIVGSHGERIINFLRPGFHSGTLPRLFAGLRTSKGRKQRQGKEGLHHIKEDIQRFVERTFLAILHTSRIGRAGTRFAVGKIKLAINRIRIEVILVDSTDLDDSLWIELSNRGRWLFSEVIQAGWIAAFTENDQQIILSALTGFYKCCGVDLVIEHLNAKLPVGTRWDINTDNLILTFMQEDMAPVRIKLDSIEPVQVLNRLLVGRDLLFSQQALLWEEWTRYWDMEQTGVILPLLLSNHVLTTASVSNHPLTLH